MNKIFEPATTFNFKPADYVPFKDRELCEKLRKISGTDLEKHSNPDFNIKVMMNPHPVLIATLFERIKAASDAGRKITLILGNPEPDTYIPLAQLINYFKVDCKTFTYLLWTNGQTKMVISLQKRIKQVLHTQCLNIWYTKLMKNYVCL